jgi:rhodanese-related sulfurtransferase
MKKNQAKSAKGMARVFLLPCLIALSALLCSCPEPPKKPIPPLDLSKATEKDKPTEEITAKPTGPGQVSRMPLGDLYQLVQSNAALIYDVRPTIFHKMGNVPGSISWPQASFDRDLAKHEPRIRAANAQNTPVVIYCTDLACPDAVTVATKLAERGYNVSVLQGGYEAWKVATP